MNHIILIGPTGVGKTSVGERLSQKLSLKHIDTDQEILKLFSDKDQIADIFFDLGEEEFRNLEGKIIESLKEAESCVLSLGGGFITTEKNRQLLENLGSIFYLFANPNLLLKNRGAIPRYVQGDEEKFKMIMKQRNEHYTKCSNYTCCMDNKTIEEASNAVITMIGN